MPLVTLAPAARRRARLGLAGLLLALAASASAVAGHGRTASDCAPLRAAPAYVDAVYGALAAREDVWGDRVVGAPQGPTYAAVRGRLNPGGSVVVNIGHPNDSPKLEQAMSATMGAVFKQRLSTTPARYRIDSRQENR